MYKVLGSDGKEYGPANAATLQRWIAEGRVNAQTQVQAEGSTDWKPLSQFPELQALLVSFGPPPTLPSEPAALPAGPAVKPQEKTLAVVSLVLGVLSLVTCLFTGIPAIITGAIARSRSRRDPARYGGSDLALAGLILGCCGTLLGLVVLSALLPALAKANDRGTVRCVNNLRQIGLAALIYASDHQEVFPPDFRSLSNEFLNPKVLTCPADRARRAATDWAEFSPANVTYPRFCS